MTTEAVKNATKTFKYSYPACTNEELLFKLEVPVEIPHNGSTRELVQRVIKMFHIPVYLEDELNEQLAQFVERETKAFHNERDEKLLNQLKNSELNVEGIVKGWEKLFKENVMEFAEQKGTPDEEVFAAAYHKLVHSPALDTILQVEDSYAATVLNTLKSQEDDIQKLTQEQTEEMEEKVRLLNIGTTEEEINTLATTHFEAQSVAAARWASQLEALRHAQRAAHRAWLLNTLEEYQPTAELLTPSNSPLATFPTEQTIFSQPTPQTKLEESFTIHLGSQLKQTHNIRITSQDLLDLCRIDCDNASDPSRRLQTCLSLYSSELSGVVLITDSPPERPTPPTTTLLLAAHSSTDHHFSDAEAQLREICEKVKEPVERRNLERCTAEAGVRPPRRPRSLQPGDVFITKHSNLAETHVVFHLIADDSSLRSGDITSRHPVFLGLRNILKAASAHDITSLALPLLLRHELTEEMTLSWCLRRGELVLKCVKGFMLEAAGGGGAQLRTLQAAAPPAPPPLHRALAALTTHVFRPTNPVKLK